jgi:hypothetical protein
MKTLATPVVVMARLAVALLLSLAAVFATAGGASALPTAEFTFTPKTPMLGQPVSFTFTGTCDTPPSCTISWRYFRAGGSHLGTTMASGTNLTNLTYTFPGAGTYSVVAEITNSGSTHGSATATHTLTVQDTFEDSDRKVVYDGWRGVADPTASTGGYRSASATGDIASYTFTGTQVTYVARTGPTKGIASVAIAGSTPTTVDLYSPQAGTRSFPVTGLTDAAHTIAVRPTGTKNPASTGTQVNVDEFVVGATRVDDRASVIRYSTWRGLLRASASGGSLRRSATPGASTSFAFSGTSVTWLSVEGPRQGIADVFVDGRRVGSVDAYAPKDAFKVAHTFAGLTNGQHVIRVVVRGAHNPNSAGDLVTSDAFVLG